jgi:AraC-like DNA-binding protein
MNVREQSIRDRIREVIAARAAIRGLTPEEVAKAAGIDDRQMARAMRGASGFSFYSLERAATALGWSLGELMYVAFPPPAKGRRLPVRGRAHAAARNLSHD